MHLNDFDLRQLAARDLGALSVAEKDQLLKMLLSDLLEAQERLRANSRNSSRPPSSDPPWSGPRNPASRGAAATEGSAEAGKGATTQAEAGSSPTAAEPNRKPVAAERRKPGRQPGAPGHSRTLTGPVAGTITHFPEACALCGQGLSPSGFVARTGFYVLDLKTELEAGLRGLQVLQHKHLYGECRCERCGHLTRTEPERSPAEPHWKVALSEWGCVGPTLMSLIVCLSLRMKLSRRGIQEFLRDWLAVSLSTSTLNRCLHETGRAVEPLEQALVDEVRQAAQAYADETPWKEWGLLLWLWVIVTPTVSLYLIGYRTAELIENALGADFSGWLMSDGYSVYRRFHHRLRCWAHLLRKARGLQESLHADARAFGGAALALLNAAMVAVYAAREGPPGVSLAESFRARLEDFRSLCESHRASPHEKTRALAGEFLNDWEAVWIVLSHPYLPLTNNEAERALRHWVILRRISHGTRTPEGSRAVALLASVIETCRKRNHLPWPYLAQVIAARRKGQPAPPLPVAA